MMHTPAEDWHLEHMLGPSADPLYARRFLNTRLVTQQIKTTYGTPTYSIITRQQENFFEAKTRQKQFQTEHPDQKGEMQTCE